MNTLFETASKNPAGFRDVLPQQVHGDGGATRIVDVREPHEFHGDLGHIRGAESVPLATIEASFAARDRQEAVVLVCRSGRRSEQAARALRAGGFARVMNLVGGMLGWSEARLPVEGMNG